MRKVLLTYQPPHFRSVLEVLCYKAERYISAEAERNRSRSHPAKQAQTKKSNSFDMDDDTMMLTRQ